MATDHRVELRKIRTFPSLVRYLRDEMGWPIDTEDFEELTFEYTPEELDGTQVVCARDEDELVVLAAHSHSRGLVLLRPDRDVEDGSVVS